ncbi:MAG: geranylgeranylglyceryl/heptaprenylglyceryl phosphate synthase [Flavobacteriaceae bacterium]|nr:geranylgeranylglyceryl/heptaprenylglyceryl phosphate synthase [Flavobacteriaceae bacterium]
MKKQIYILFLSIFALMILDTINTAKINKEKLLAILLDPDKIELENLPSIIKKIDKSSANLIFVGGSLLFKNVLDEFLKIVKQNTNLPVILFPGSAIQISNEADAILFLQLISGRNPEYLISNQVIAAPLLKQTNLEVISTGYLLIESGRETTASYISNTKPLPAHKPEIAVATALAGEYIGHKLIYLDGGSGALNPVSITLIKKVAKAINLPIIVGGGLKTKQQIDAVFNAGATVVVVGTAFEDDTTILKRISQ